MYTFLKYSGYLVAGLLFLRAFACIMMAYRARHGFQKGFPCIAVGTIIILFFRYYH